MKISNKGQCAGQGYGAISWLIVILLALAGTVKAQDAGPEKADEQSTEQADKTWPKKIDAGKALIVIYQPQVESFEGDSLSARSAVSVKLKEAKEGEKNEPVFGVIWLVAKVETDREERMVHVRSLKIPRVRFAGSTPEEEAKLAEVIEAEMPKWDHNISLDRLLTSLALVESEKKGADNLSTAAPRIIYSKEPAVLVTIDGEPQLTTVEGASHLMRVINTPFLIVFDSTLKKYFLYAGKDAWYSAADLETAWSIDQAVPKQIAALAPDETDQELSESDEGGKGVVPKILLVTQPSELIYTSGAPAFTPISGTGLMYVSNSDSNLFMEMDKRIYYVLLSGRWYSSQSLSGGWKYVEADQLPKAFQRIPEDSDVADVRAFVYGTQEASEAVLDAQIPQTAKVKRGEAKLKVVYDGDPQFAAIPGTELQYAVNTESEVLLADGRYYVCDAGVWYVSAAAQGPWQVADARPEGVDGIPPESPVYNVKYVYVYDSTPEYVYVGYTPGYTGCYIYRGMLVYGTGYHYRAWHRGGIYYGRPVTWGYAVRYNPWVSAWSFGVVYSNGHFTFGMGYGSWGRWHGGWWGAGFYSGYWRGHSRGFYHGFHRGYYQGYKKGYWAGRHHGSGWRHPRPELYGHYQRPGVLPYHRNIRPVTLPARPGNRPGIPITRPTVPGKPSQPIARPGVPSTRPPIPGKPSQPIAKPGMPSTRPTIPGKPSQPIAKPGMPSTRPTIPGKPSQPIAKPGMPSTRPTIPGKPSQPIAKPGVPSTRPAIPGKPSQPIAKPGGPTTLPATLPAKPAPSIALDRANNVYADRSGNVYQRLPNGSWNHLANGRPAPVTRPSTPTARPAIPTTRPITTRPTTTRPTTRPTTTRPTTRPTTTRPSTRISPSARSSLNKSYQSRQRGSTRTVQSSRSSRSMSSGRSRGGGGRGGRR